MDKDNHESAMAKDTKDKGKGTAINIDESLSESTKKNGHSSSVEAGLVTTSFVSRLSASASKLTGDMVLQHPSGGSLADALPADKAESSRLGRGAGMDEISTDRSSLAQRSIPSSFKSAQSQEEGAQIEFAFSDFLNSSTSILEERDPGNVKALGDEQINKPALEKTQRTIPRINPTDGIDVVELLNSAYSEAEETYLDLTDIEQATIRHHLFEDGESGERVLRRRWDDALNFFPDLGSNSGGIHEYANLIGTSNVEEAKSIWVSQWQGVLSSYTDEVWGELGPLVNKAREELTSLSVPYEEASPSKLKAVRRLQQLLSHIRGT
ncbi:uncharacterized protein F4812DRAFT_429249 [Daldinia caldariorum]|uniref:uncharacterized protein n=1 Tax=Daldinia caldariorum TaxID=326644 RepID=UPI002007499A|nr:uncharacterized protein F4812DRAFT_429249 [Daldinia caldariorum]KAI1467366.1 hypothetical protein F4812DRAFT_429249 [Daldinia caldariorum]